MSEALQHFKALIRNDFGSTIFLLVVGTIAFAFIGYLLFDYFRGLIMILRIKRRHRQERREHRHS